MLSWFCNKVCDRFVCAGIIAEEQKPLYYYGIHQGTMMLLNVLTTVAIGFILGMLWQSLVFLLAYIPIRSNAGGFHASTPLRCYLSSIILIIFVLLLLKLIPWNSIFFGCGMIMSFVIIFFFSPVEDKNKPFTKAEHRCFRKRTRMLLMGEVFVIAVCCLWKAAMFANCVMLSLATLSVMLLLGKAKNVALDKKALSGRNES